MEEIIEVCFWRISADKRYKNTHKGVKMQTKSLQNHQDWNRHRYKKRKGTLWWLLLRIKLNYSLFGNTPSKILKHIETSQSICFANQLTGFYITQTSTERYLQTDFNGTFQGIKKKIISQTRVVFRTLPKITDSALSKK